VTAHLFECVPCDFNQLNNVCRHALKKKKEKRKRRRRMFILRYCYKIMEMPQSRKQEKRTSKMGKLDTNMCCFVVPM
jgi:hypothetical protein